MAIDFGCPVCGGTLRVEDDAIGQVVRCGGCMSMLRVPERTGQSPQFPSTSASPFPELPRPAFPESQSPPPSTRSLTGERKAADEPQPKNERVRGPQPQRRRRTRRDETTPPPGRSTTFWVLITLCSLGIGSCLFCCGLYPLVSAPRWQTHQSPKGGFKVDLPAAPKSTFSVRGIKEVKFSIKVPIWRKEHMEEVMELVELTLPRYEIEGSRIWARGEDYAILRKDISSIRDRKGDNHKVFEVAESDLKEMGFIKIAEGVSAEKSTYPTREYHFQNMAGGTYVVRVIVVGSRLYILLVGGVMGHPEEENIERFFSSFTVTDQKLKDEEESWPVTVLGMALADRTIETIDKETNQAEINEAKQERSHALGMALGHYLTQVVEAEWVRVDERKRATRQGMAIGKAVADAIEADIR